MTSAVDKVKDSFPFLSVEPIIGQPTYDSIRELNKKLNANAASVYSHLGNGKLGLLYLTVTPEVYNTLTQFQIQAAEKLHEEKTRGRDRSLPS